ncbi:MAG: Kae1-associated kinase Bud32 [Archaeoglobi archaeon]|jgi:TP53 regulating kinase-like protein|nr:Kae1-associated kinase Bud32 [Archaeoglobus sp.]NHW89074.1 Kae1-associated kinase Bud32 [Archaeoglobales archaeon]TDA28378.1 MAG: Kae1-associated kinase Bud32 [Archaeoglobi archaeon]
MIYLGGEAEVVIGEVVVKKRRPKRYRIREIDEILRLRRTRTEAKLISLARRIGVPTPIVLDVEGDTIVMERIYGTPVKDCMSEEISREIGRLVAKLHNANIVHGDITPMNMILSEGKIYFVDFGLAFVDNRVEAKGVDVHVYFESLKAGFENWESLKKAFVEGYLELGKEEVIKRAEEIEERGRYVERRLK